MKSLWIGTTNNHKKKEFIQLFFESGIKIFTPNDLEFYSPPAETGKTFKENALIKAKNLAAVVNTEWVIGEDSGIVCDGLNGYPGIFSARYAGDNASDMENLLKLLKMMSIRSGGNNKAHYFCSIAAISPEGKEYFFEDQLNGTITNKPNGTQGFGYDPVFIPEGFEKTMAELSPGEKNKISHRAKAGRALREVILAS